MKNNLQHLIGIGLLALGGLLAAAAGADEIIEMATYIPAPGTGNDLDRFHAKRATIGETAPLNFSLSNPAEPNPPDGTLLVSGRVGIGTATPGYTLDVNNNGTGETRPIAVFRGVQAGRDPRLNIQSGNTVTGTPYLLLQTDSAGGAVGFPNLVLQSVGGNVGIGTAAPAGKLTMDGTYGTNNIGLHLRESGVDKAYFAIGGFGLGGVDNNDLIIRTAEDIHFSVNGQPPIVTFKNSGNVGIGVTAPSQKLELPVDTVIKIGNAYFFEGSGGYAHWGLNWFYTGATGWQAPVAGIRSYVMQCNPIPGSDGFRFYTREAGASGGGMNGGVERFRIAHNGNVYANGVLLNPPSDLRLKERVRPIPNALERVSALHGVTFHWKGAERDSGLQMGLVGQEVQRVFPELVGVDSDGMLAVSYPQLTAVLVEAVKELKEENGTLKSRMALLEGKLNDRGAAKDGERGGGPGRRTLE